jgi:hypothetical protein
MRFSVNQANDRTVLDAVQHNEDIPLPARRPHVGKNFVLWFRREVLRKDRRDAGRVKTVCLLDIAKPPLLLIRSDDDQTFGIGVRVRQSLHQLDEIEPIPKISPIERVRFNSNEGCSIPRNTNYLDSAGVFVKALRE